MFNCELNKYTLTDKEKRALVWRIEHYKNSKFNYLALNYEISPEMESIITYVEELVNKTSSIAQDIAINAMHIANETEAKTILKMKNSEKEKHAKGGIAKGKKNKLFKEKVFQEYDKFFNKKQPIKKFVNDIVDRLNQGEFENLQPYFTTTTPEATIQNWITTYRKTKKHFSSKMNHYSIKHI